MVLPGVVCFVPQSAHFGCGGRAGAVLDLLRLAGPPRPSLPPLLGTHAPSACFPPTRFFPDLAILRLLRRCATRYRLKRGWSARQGLLSELCKAQRPHLALPRLRARPVRLTPPLSPMLNDCYKAFFVVFDVLFIKKGSPRPS